MKFSEKSLAPEEVKKIGILRANALGDFIVTLPAIAALKNYFINAEIVLFGSTWHKEFLEESYKGLRRTPVDRVVVVPVMKGIRTVNGKEENAEEIDDFFNRARKENFDIVLSFQGKGIAATPFIKNINPRITVGQVCKESEKPDLNFEYYYYQPEVIRYLEIASLTGAPINDLDPKVNLLPGDKEEADKFIKKFIKGKFIAIHPCGSDVRRMWTKENFFHLSIELKKQGWHVVYTGTKEDETYIKEIIPDDSDSFTNAAGILSLGAVAALYKKSEVVISVDTGPMHLAVATGARTIGMYWIPNFINWAPLKRINHRPIISWEMKCPICGVIPNDPHPYEPTGASCVHNISFIRDINVEQVLNEVKLLTHK